MSISGAANGFGDRRTILAWHVHGSWMSSFVAGGHRYLLPVTAEGGSDGRGRCGRDWPDTVEIRAADLRAADVNLVVLQRPNEFELAERWLGRRLGRDIPAVYVEHNAPRPHPVDSVHPMAARTDVPVVHVTDFNRLMWDNGRAPTMVIEHGLADPGDLYTGEEPAAAAMINEPIRRARTVGTDLLGELAAVAPVHVWGMGTESLNEPAHRRAGVRGMGDLPGPRLLPELARRRVYLHTARWTSLGMSLVEAMIAGMPVVAVASTAAPSAVPAQAGVVSADPAELAEALAVFLSDRTAAQIAGKAARAHALNRFGLGRFLARWDELIGSVCR